MERRSKELQAELDELFAEIDRAGEHDPDREIRERLDEIFDEAG